MIEKNWKTLAGEKIDLRSAIEAELHRFPEVQITIASDSQQRGEHTEFVSVVTIIRPGKGGRVFFCREYTKRIRDLGPRLWEETWRSTQLAMELSKTETDETNFFERPMIDIDAIHIDANVDPKHKSSQYVEQLVGLVIGMGFRAVVKPEAWAASHAADHAVKHKEERNKPHAEKNGRRRAA